MAGAILIEPRVSGKEAVDIRQLRRYKSWKGVRVWQAAFFPGRNPDVPLQ